MLHSPNYGYPRGLHGRHGYPVRAIVIHIGEGYRGGFHALFGAGDQVSAHFVVYRSFDPLESERPQIEQWVSMDDAAWHAGNVREPTTAGWEVLVEPEETLDLPVRLRSYDGYPGGVWVNPNLYTIGIEHEGFSGEEWTEAMYEADAFLVRLIRQRWPGAVLLRHGDIDSVTRAGCPGPGVDLEEIERRV